MFSKRIKSCSAIALTLAATLYGPASWAEDDPTDAAAAPVNEKYNMNMKKMFATYCSWCHQGYGMKQADGPRLAGTKKTLEQVKLQISNGKSPMPGFRKQLKEVEIQALAEYIKGLPE
jgi:mono/diheme cytochrome c family protein